MGIREREPFEGILEIIFAIIRFEPDLQLFFSATT